VGIGEPLLHKDIAAMIKYAASKNVANVLEILTNASLLTKELSKNLIKNGLSRLVVSVQGTTKEKYKKVSGVDIDFNKYIGNLRYFFKNKDKAQVYIKIVDTALEDKNDEQRFYDIFGDICDALSVEHTVPIHHGIDYGKLLKNNDLPVTQFGLPVSEVKICPQPFFTMQINPDGKVVPCYSFEYPEIIGDCNNQSACEIWNSEHFRKFRRLMLEGVNAAGKVCSKCDIIKYRLFPEDVLDGAVERLKKIY
jgi:radical SAM protein with 4Fe4S-binding SPASM domain